MALASLTLLKYAVPNNDISAACSLPSHGRGRCEGLFPNNTNPHANYNF